MDEVKLILRRSQLNKVNNVSCRLPSSKVLDSRLRIYFSYSSNKLLSIRQSFHATVYVELVDPQLLHQTPFQSLEKLIVQYGQLFPDPQTSN